MEIKNADQLRDSNIKAKERFEKAIERQYKEILKANDAGKRATIFWYDNDLRYEDISNQIKKYFSDKGYSFARDRVSQGVPQLTLYIEW
ncbi:MULTISPECIES: hypothetical protein [Staphylococcus]|jgi:hypothetical protein|uniref:hypothetical protein n=1 Tax=Staphylococcus TaxID=1279 RepID=UPI0016434278|nr:MULTISPECIES: hypothetical protein [Staphylococcus]MBC2921942.1 hypothetical protein [Staphylococcus saprophyticus]MBC2958535.1 hypothetical protein [Staphylococcus saprophyticus]MBC3010382.1 hypothetical protein [Staphylococcus saprophyticus]MBC3024261.1 hypothetical protein [Staphylococcus saprophyticus]MBC3031488.1 hypothetical protein [Staphylococcus saprophyticus]